MEKIIYLCPFHIYEIVERHFMIRNGHAIRKQVGSDIRKTHSRNLHFIAGNLSGKEIDLLDSRKELNLRMLKMVI